MTSIFPNQMDKRTKEAMNVFWTTRSNQIQRQNDISVTGQGNRRAATSDIHLEGVVELIRDIIIENGIEEKFIYFNSHLVLPGFYRPNKKWDLLVVEKKRLVIAIEIICQVGSQYGSNFNNRVGEALGNAVDIWTAYREGVFGTKQTPWLGYFVVLEDCIKSNEPVKANSSHFEVMPEFINSSYMKRYELFCRKLILERLYSSTCLVTTRNDKDCFGNYDCPAEDLSIMSFASSMVSAIKAYNASK